MFAYWGSLCGWERNRGNDLSVLKQADEHIDRCTKLVVTQIGSVFCQFFYAYGLLAYLLVAICHMVSASEVATVTTGHVTGMPSQCDRNAVTA